MKAVVVYESHWGNTRAIAGAIAEGLGEDVPVLATDEATRRVLAHADLVVAGAPILGFSLPTETVRDGLPREKKAPTPADVSHPSMRSWLKGVPQAEGKLAAAFETRIWWSPGSSAKKILAGLGERGYAPVAEGGRFVVTDRYGPLKGGEIERARQWGEELARSAEGHG